MRSKLVVLTLTLFLVGLSATLALGQQSFADPTVEFTFALPEPKWKMTVKPTAVSGNVEYVYGDRADGHLQIRKMSVPKDSIMMDIIESEERGVQFRQGYVAGKEETFAGKLRGSVFNFEYVAAGRNMSGRFYFLRANETTVYVLRFSGPKDQLRSLRNQTDSIARTFGIKS